DGTEVSMTVFVQDGDGESMPSHNLFIRVLDQNDWPEMTVPADATIADPALTPTLEFSSDTAAPGDPDNLNPDFSIADPDNDESTDGNGDDDPDGTDGEGDDVLFAMWTTCGWIELRNSLWSTFGTTLE